MSRTLAEDIDRGRRAIELARQRGRDTSDWEESLADLERQGLLAWANELAEQELVLGQRAEFIEAPLRPVFVAEVSKYAARQLRFIALANIQQRTGGIDGRGPEWFKGQAEVAFGAPQALRVVLSKDGLADGPDGGG